MSRLKWLEIIIKIITFDYFSIRHAVRMLARRSGLTASAKVLDVGCGTGVLANMFSSKCYLGFDIDHESIMQAKHSHPKYKFIQANAINPPLGNKKYDLVLISGVIHHLNNSDRNLTFKMIRSHLNRLGKIVMIEAIPPIYSWNIIGQVIRKLDQGHHIHELKDYVRLTKKYFKVIDSYQQIGGLVDYGVVFAGN